MASLTLKVREVDAVEILSLVDNSVDFQSTVSRSEVQSFRQWTGERYGIEWAKMHSLLPIAEHGFSMLIRVLVGGKSNSVLFDTGGSFEGIVVNAERMGLDLGEVDCIALSHGHYDHFGGLPSALRVINKANLPVIVHEGMFKNRGTLSSDGTIREYLEFPKGKQLSFAKLIKTKQPSLISGETILVTGEIPRKTSYEKGFPRHMVKANGEWQPDPWIWDDRAIVINVKGKGLVILSGCAHAGIINTVNYSRKITGLKRIHAVIGGFHLAGKTNEERIKQSVEELRKMNPNLIAPSHCTGWRAKCATAKAMPNAFVWNSVGNLYQL